MRPSELVEQVGGSYSAELEIDLTGGDSAEIYKWLLASILFGARVSQSVAKKTYRQFAQAKLLSPHKLLEAGWDNLVGILDRGGYVRYDFKTATKLLNVSATLLQRYDGDLNALHAVARDESDLERRIKQLGKGIGDTTVNIFLRELRGIWKKAMPAPSERAMVAAKALRFVPASMHDPEPILKALKAAGRADHARDRNFSSFEAALVRYEARTRKNRSPL